MKLGDKGRAVAYLASLVIFLLVFSYLVLVYTRGVDGVSMRPTLEAGDLAVIEGVKIGDVKVGDIVIFDLPSQTGCIDFTVIHRVVAIDPSGGLMTQGDNRRTNPTPDEPANGPLVQQSCLIGKVVFVIPYIRRIADLFPAPTNYVLAALIILFLFLSEARRSRAPDAVHQPLVA